MTITGSVQFQDFEGGFWGIVGDNNEQYLPVNELPDNVRSNGCRVKATVEPANVISFTMWGQSVKVLHIETI
ncbi:MAG: hypothetical protein HKN43_05155 [Rhodothermales bacterium]|nr:hypothetical protein [Rhodothermales bacterium]